MSYAHSRFACAVMTWERRPICNVVELPAHALCETNKWDHGLSGKDPLHYWDLNLTVLKEPCNKVYRCFRSSGCGSGGPLSFRCGWCVRLHVFCLNETPGFCVGWSTSTTSQLQQLQQPTSQRECRRQCHTAFLGLSRCTRPS